jgi:KDO2-lipid IV(A) lauroyltransferase
MTKEGKGVILVTAHIGNFEMLPAWGFYGDLPSTVMYRPQNNWRVERLLLGARSAYLPNVVRRSTTGLMTLSYVLRDAGSVGLLVDMNTLDGPVFCDFLGYLAASPPGAAALALATDAPVILALAIRQTDGKHRMIFHPPFTTIRTGNKKRDIQANTQQYMKAIEGYVLAYPEQYNWPHPRWRYRPDGTFWTLEHDSAELAKEQVGGARRPLVDPTPEVLKRAQRRDPMRKAA